MSQDEGRNDSPAQVETRRPLPTGSFRTPLLPGATIGEIRAEKRLLDVALLRLIGEFEQRFGVTVSSVDLVQVRPLGGTRRTVALEAVINVNL